MEKTMQVFLSWEISQSTDCTLQWPMVCCARTNVCVYGLAMDFRGWQIAKSAQNPHLTTWLDIFVFVDGFSQIWFENAISLMLLLLLPELLQWNQSGTFLISFLFILLTRISNQTLFLWMCYLFIWQWVLRIISETLKFSRSMVLFECESMSKSVWAVINYGFECAYIYVGDSREWRFIPYSTH